MLITSLCDGDAVTTENLVCRVPRCGKQRKEGVRPTPWSEPKLVARVVGPGSNVV